MNFSSLDSDPFRLGLGWVGSALGWVSVVEQKKSL